MLPEGRSQRGLEGAGSRSALLDGESFVLRSPAPALPSPSASTLPPRPSPPLPCLLLHAPPTPPTPGRPELQDLPAVLGSGQLSQCVPETSRSPGAVPGSVTSPHLSPVGSLLWASRAPAPGGTFSALGHLARGGQMPPQDGSAGPDPSSRARSPETWLRGSGPQSGGCAFSRPSWRCWCGWAPSPSPGNTLHPSHPSESVCGLPLPSAPAMGRPQPRLPERGWKAQCLGQDLNHAQMSLWGISGC